MADDDFDAARFARAFQRFLDRFNDALPPRECAPRTQSQRSITSIVVVSAPRESSASSDQTIAPPRRLTLT